MINRALYVQDRNLVEINCPELWAALSLREKIGALLDLELVTDERLRRLVD